MVPRKQGGWFRKVIVGVRVGLILGRIALVLVGVETVLAKVGDNVVAGTLDDMISELEAGHGTEDSTI